MTKQEYSHYMSSTEWRNKRIQKLIESNYCCKKNGDGECSGNLIVHHKTYKHFMYEPMSDLEVLCSRHHRLEHLGKQVIGTFDFVRDEEVTQAIIDKIDELVTESFRIYDKLKALQDFLGYNNLSKETIEILNELGFTVSGVGQ